MALLYKLHTSIYKVRQKKCNLNVQNKGGVKGLLNNVRKIPSKLEVAPLYAKCWLDGWILDTP